MNPLDRLRADHLRRARLWAPPKPVVEALEQDIAATVVAEIVTIEPKLGKTTMANTGAKGFAAIVKARAAKMRDDFSKLADEINGEFDAQDNLLQEGKNQHAEMKKDTAELRDALGLGNNPPA
jgi:hypothetical protein